MSGSAPPIQLTIIVSTPRQKCLYVPTSTMCAVCLLCAARTNSRREKDEIEISKGMSEETNEGKENEIFAPTKYFLLSYYACAAKCTGLLTKVATVL